MKVFNNVHQQFAEYFPSENLRPYLYLLSKKMSEGHICIDPEEIEMSDLDNLYPLPKRFPKYEKLVSDGSKTEPFIIYNHRLYLHRYFRYESIIADSIRQFIKNEEEQIESNEKLLKEHSSFIKELFSVQQKPEADVRINWQLIAALSASLNQFTIITGGPGTGKTTTVAKILAILYSINPALKVALAAPTGKAAARMGESLKNATTNANIGMSDAVKKGFETIVPSTIHRLLGYQPHSIYFKHDQNNPVNYDVVIIDESSMIDVALFAKLFLALGPETKVILLGDKDQLASVEAGSLFGDLCQAQEKLNLFPPERMEFINSFIEDKSQQLPESHISKTGHPLAGHVIELQVSHRFSDDEGIGKFSKAIIQNKPQIISDFFKNLDEQVQVDSTYSDKIFQNFIAGYKTFIEEKDILEALKKLNNLKVLCVIREGEQGLYAINKKIEQYLIKQNLINITGDFYYNRPVMITSNNYELSLFNGDIGLVRVDENGELKVWFEDKGNLLSFSPSYVSNAETVFAMTIHKSQGSEFDKVMVILPDMEDVPLLTRELLYTAVTRAKSKVIVQGEESAILKAADSYVKRGSGIIQRFNQ
ncbi:MAG: exodeoxyribonuclease V subunit alpha [Ginsengibacter sp.]